MRYSFSKRPPKVAAAASKDASRPALTAAWLDTADGELRATDSYVAVRVPVGIDADDTDGWVAADTLERSRKRDGGGISCNGAAAVYTVPPDGDEPGGDWLDHWTVGSFPRPDVGTPPNLKQLWPEDRGGFTVAINAGFLKRVADAIGAEDSVVRLTFQETSEARPNPLKAILVTPNKVGLERTDGRTGLGSPEGVIMPVRVI